MKKLVKIAMAVAALFTVACTTDATEDLGIQLVGVDGDGQTTITLSLEESRTQLGEKAGEVYPLVWSEGDKISVNGVESGEAVINVENAANATFAISGVSTPYAIAYPAAPAGQVLFADKQAYTSNTTFGNGIATMYAYSESGLGLQLNHLTGVLKIGVVGSAKLALAQISTIDRAPIAGAFDLDFTTGELKSTTSSKEVIEYSFGEGVQLSEEPTYLHVAVPAGVYDELYVTLYDVDGGVMYATAKADESKPLSVGKVREFSSNIPYAATDHVFVVKDVATLKEFAEAAPTLEKDVLFVADVDMTGEEWTPIEGYAKTVRGNGYAIKGLTAPLFGTTNASIKGLHLRDVALVTNNTSVMGGLACVVKATDTVAPVIEHCSVSGTLQVSNPTYISAKKNDRTNLVYAGVVARSIGANISDCVNHVDIEVVQSANAGCTLATLCTVGGVVASTEAYTNTADKTVINYVKVSGCTNRGTITTKDAIWPHGEGKVSYFVGGVVAYVAGSNCPGGEVVNCTNDAAITLNDINAYGGGEYSMIGGVVGYVTLVAGNLFEILDCVNTKNGVIKVAGKGSHAYVGGVAGYTYNCEYANITNYAEILGEAEMTGHFYLAGCLCSPGVNDSATEENKDTFIARYFKGENIVNYGDVTINGYASTMKIGGVYARGSQSDLTNCENHGNITLNMDNSATTQSLSLMVGGFGGEGVGDGDAGTELNCANYAPVNITLNCTNVTYLGLAGYCGYSHHYLNGCKNDEKGMLTVKGNIALTKNGVLEDSTTDSQYCIGGISGYKAAKGNIDTSNYGDVVIDVVWTSAENIKPILQVGGFTGRNHNTQAASCKQYGDVYFKGNSQNFHGVTCLGGSTGSYIYKSGGRNNDGNIYVSGTHGLMYIGGISGYVHRYKENALLTNAVNNGSINIGVDKNGNAVSTTFATETPRIGGLLGWTLSNITDSTNNGDINVNANITATAGTTYIAGCLGYAQNIVDGTGTAIDMTLNNIKNTGNINIDIDYGARELQVGGIVGYMYGKSTQKNLTNDGDISVNMRSGTNYVRVGGIAEAIRNHISDCTNNGDITLTGKAGSSIYVGGIMANPNGYNRSNLTNNGNILVDCTVKTDCWIGGMCYDLTNGANISYTNCINNGNLVVGTKAVVGASTAVGGMIGKSTTNGEKKNFVRCQNNGDIIFKGKSKGHARIGGLMGYTSGGLIVIVKDGYVNTGKVEFSGSTDGADRVHIGGLFGYIDGSFMSYDTTSTSTDENGVETSTTTTTTWTGNIVNKGDVIFSGKSIGGLCRAGGIFGYLNQPLSANARYINLGTIKFTGDAGQKTDDNGNPVIGVGSVGGIVGVLNGVSATNCEVYCDLYTKGADNFGMVTGSERSATCVVTNSKVGGQLIGEFDEEDQTYKTTVLSESDYFNYIYGSGEATDWTGTDNYDGCSYISVAPAI